MPDRKEFCVPWPPSVNHYWYTTVLNGRPQRYISPEGRAYKKKVQALVRAGGLFTRPLESRVAVWIGAAPPNRRRRDLDNLLKALLDALTFAGVWLDDSQIDRLTIERMDAVKGGVVCVTIDEFQPGNRQKDTQ